MSSASFGFGDGIEVRTALWSIPRITLLRAFSRVQQFDGMVAEPCGKRSLVVCITKTCDERLGW